MVLVNNPGDWSSLYPQLAHAKWHGWTFTDLIFPFFLFIGGVSMALSLGRLAAAGADKPQLLVKLAKRAALIFLIGFAAQPDPQFQLRHRAHSRRAAAHRAVHPAGRADRRVFRLARAAGVDRRPVCALQRADAVRAGARHRRRRAGTGPGLRRLRSTAWCSTATCGCSRKPGIRKACSAPSRPCAASCWACWPAAGCCRSDPRTDQTVWMLLAGLLLRVAGRHPRHHPHADQQEPVDAVVQPA